MAATLLPEHDACLQCTWRTLFHWKRDLAHITARPTVQCEIEGTRSYCNACVRLHDACENVRSALPISSITDTTDHLQQIAEFLEGDHRDLFALLRWGDEIIARRTMVQHGNASVSMRLWTDEEKRQLMRAGIDLFAAFKDIEKAHRVEHGLDVGKRRRQQVS